MPVERNQVEHVARLAHLALDPAEIDEMAVQLSSILDHVATLQKLDIGGVEPTSQVLPAHNVMRDDEITVSWNPEAVLANAPHRNDDFFAVPAVLE